MQITINNYYLSVLNNMITYLENSEAGKRRWSTAPASLYTDYSSTTRSTFPDWTKFFFVKTPKDERLKYLEINSTAKYLDGYYHGSKSEFRHILE